MNREEAQFILGAYRPDSEDAQDPQFQEALALAARDPALARWLAEEQALHRAFAAKLRAGPIPPDLKKQLLLARATNRRAPWWRQPVWLAAAGFAVLAAVGGSLVLRQATDPDFARFRREMAATSTNMSGHAAVWGLDAAGYRQWLATHEGDSGFILPPGLADKGISACKVIAWHEARVTMLCFKFSGQHVDVFVVNEANFPAAKFGPAPTFHADGAVNTAMWRRDGKVYLLAGAIAKSELQALL